MEGPLMGLRRVRSQRQALLPRLVDPCMPAPAVAAAAAAVRQAIKESTVRGLEPEIQRLVEAHKAELKRVEHRRVARCAWGGRSLACSGPLLCMQCMCTPSGAEALSWLGG